MKLSTKTRYGVRAMLDLALHQDQAPVSLKDIAERQQLSLAYLEQLVGPLIAAGLVRSVRGPKGGISLARASRQIKLGEIYQALEGSTAPVGCVDDPGLCPRSRFCVTRDVWSEVKGALDAVLESRTLDDLVERERTKASEGTMYYI